MRQQSSSVSVYDKPQPSQHFDMSQIQQTISAISADQTEFQKPTRSRIPSLNGSKDVIPDTGVKKERIKNLWGKVGKQGLLQAATVAKQPEGPPPTKWDQVLNPLMQQQQRRHDRTSAMSPNPASSYYTPTVGGEAGGGSGFYGQPGNATMECDCGDDSCPQCNLMLNMGSGF